MRDFADIDLPAGHRLLHLVETTSTNTQALEHVSKGEAGPLWIVANRQTQGRGRRQRAWVSIEGNLHTSLVLSPDCAPDRIAELGFVAGLACYDAVSAGLNDAAKVILGEVAALALKWPNDLLIDDKKAAGILLERAASPEGAKECVVIGFGINITGHPEEVNFPAIHLKSYEPDIDKVDLVEALAAAMVHWLDVWKQGQDFATIREIWTKRAYGLGQAITVDLETKQLMGCFRGIDENGAMLVETSNGKVETVMAGDYRGLAR